MISAKLTLLMGALLPTVVCVGAYYTSYLRSMLREARHQSAKARCHVVDSHHRSVLPPRSRDCCRWHEVK